MSAPVLIPIATAQTEAERALAEFEQAAKEVARDCAEAEHALRTLAGDVWAVEVALRKLGITVVADRLRAALDRVPSAYRPVDGEGR